MNTATEDATSPPDANPSPPPKPTKAAVVGSKKVVIRFNIELSPNQLDSFFAATPLTKASPKTKADVLRTLLGGIKPSNLLKIVEQEFRFPGDRNSGTLTS